MNSERSKMKSAYSSLVEAGRVRSGKIGTMLGQECGFFHVKCPVTKCVLAIMVGPASAWLEEGLKPPAWDHVSVSLENRCPSWKEMCWVKKEFFEPDECVVQFHPPESKYVNDHSNVLHLWKICGADFPMPPLECV